jgi:hypothetical protein
VEDARHVAQPERALGGSGPAHLDRMALAMTVFLADMIRGRKLVDRRPST